MSAILGKVMRWLDTADAEIPALLRPARFMLRLLFRAALQLKRDRATLMAAAVTYRTVFALVPVLVVSLVVLRFFMGADAISQGLGGILKQLGLNDLRVDADAAANAAANAPDTVADWLEQIVQRAEGIHFGAIGAVGGVLLIYAAISMLIQIEQCFNVIYGAPSGRKFTARVTSYWTMLTLGPLGVIASLTLGSRLGTLVEPFSGFGAGAVDAGLSIGITWLILLAAYLLIPNARVRLRPAAIGALLAALLWELGKQAFRSYLGFSTGYAALYGSLGLVPVFFLWVYLTWLIVLLGLEVSRALQTLTDRHPVDPAAPAPPDPACAVAVLAACARRFHDGQPLTLGEAAAAAGLVPRTAEALIARLIEAGYVHAVERADDEPRYALARPPEDIRIEDVIRAVGPPCGGAGETIRSAMSSRFSGLELAALVREAAPGAAPYTAGP